jgi:predicted cobalt transporter CbtA
VKPRNFLVRGLLAGLLAGIAAFGVAYFIGEPPVDAAIALEHAHADGATAPVPRSLQATFGLLTGTAVLGVSLGGLVGVLSAMALGRFGAASARATALGVTAAGFVVVSLVPFLAYPPNPPGVGSADTIGQRSVAYFLLLLVSLVAAAAALLLRRALHRSLGGWYATLAAIGAYLVLVVAAVVLRPDLAQVSAGYPANLLYDFRMASLLTTVTLWAVLGVVLADLVDRLVTRPRRSERHRALT